MNNGWIKLHRKFIKWGWYHKSEMVHLFLHFLLLANHDGNEWQGIKIKRGQFVTGLPKLNQDTGISVQTLRTCINKLKSTGEITNQSTNKYRLITITKYEDYQYVSIKLTGISTGSLTDNQHTTNIQLTSNKKVKNEKKNANKDLDKLNLSSKGKKGGLNTEAVVLQRTFMKLCKEELGQSPIWNKAGYTLLCRALQNFTAKQLEQSFKDWFDESKKDEDLIQITQALSANRLNRWKINQS